MFDHAAHVVLFKKNHLFIVPASRCLLPLYWEVKEQTFCVLNEVENPEVTVESLRVWTDIYEKEDRKSGECSAYSQCSIRRCDALYGVLSFFGYRNILLFVSASEDVGNFQISDEVHRIKRVRGLDWIKLPESSAECHKVAAVMDNNVSSKVAPETLFSPLLPNGVPSPYFRAPFTPSSCAALQCCDSEESSLAYVSLVDGANKQCESILNSFCRYVRSSKDSSSFYFCSSINLAYHPQELLDLHSPLNERFGRKVNNSASRVLSRSATLSTFQWNFPLLCPFRALFRSRNDKLRMFLSCSTGTPDAPASSLKCSDPMCPTHYCSLVQQVELETLLMDEDELHCPPPPHDFQGLQNGFHSSPFCCSRPHPHYHSFPNRNHHSSASRVSSTLLLYVPAFIRGYFGEFQTKSCSANCTPGGAHLRITTYLLTRLCFPWAGTRYHRRGLDPGERGTCANMGISSFWVIGCPCSSTAPTTPQESCNNGDKGSDSRNSSAEAQKQGNIRVAVYEMIRGSIPRMWVQKTNLKIKPRIVICSDSSKSAKEICSHAMLVGQLMPAMQMMICLDCTAKGRGEQALSSAYKDGVKQYQKMRLELARSLNVSFLPFLMYLNCCIGSLVLKKMKSFSYIKEYLFNVVEATYQEQRRDDIEIEAQKKHLWSFTRWSDNLLSNDGDENNCVAQSVFFRVNCIDCIDRTTIVQSCIASMLLPAMLEYVVQGTLNETPAFKEVQNVLMKGVLSLVRAQGHSLSVLYSGTPHHLRNYPLRGYVLPHEVADIFFVMCRRWYHQNFLDGPKQDGISLVTCQYSLTELVNSVKADPGHEALEEMNRYVWYSVVCAVLPFLCVPLGFLFLDRISGCIHFFLFVFWLVALIYTSKRIVSANPTIVSKPLLSFEACRGVGGGES